MISPRYAAAIAILLAIALVPTTIHTYLGTVVADTLQASAVPAVLDGMPSAATERKPAWVWNNLQSRDWIERTYRVEGKEVLLFVGRSYDPKRLYHHPELALLRGTETEPAGVAHVKERPDVPLHTLRTMRDGRRGIGVYALLYDGRFIQDPVAFQLRTSVELLVTGRKAMTLFLASDLSGDRGHVAEAPSTKILLAAIAAFEAQHRSHQ